MDRNFTSTYAWVAWALAMQGKESEAFEWIRKLFSVRNVDEKKTEIFEKAFRDEGWRGVVREWIRETHEILGGL